MKAAPFLNVGQEGARISQLTPKGYLDNQDLKDSGETRGEFNIQLLTKTGRLDKMYIWVRTFDVDDTEEWLDDGHWVDPNGDDVVAGSENDYLFKAGSGLWTAAPELSGDEDPETVEYAFQSSGEVNQDSVKWVLTPGGNVAKGNPFCVPFKMSSLIPAGYEDNQDLKDSGETRGEFNIQLLTQTGRLDKMYIWVRTFDVDDTEEWLDDGHWVDPNGDDIVAGGENDYEIKMGEGLWVAAPELSGDEDPETAEYSITVNCPVKL